MLGTITRGPGFLPNSAEETPWESELCKTMTKATELNRNRAATRTSPPIRRSSPLQGGFSEPGLIATPGGETTGSTGGSTCMPGTTWSDEDNWVVYLPQQMWGGRPRPPPLTFVAYL